MSTTNKRKHEGEFAKQSFNCDSPQCRYLLDPAKGGFYVLDCEDEHHLCMECAVHFLASPPVSYSYSRSCPSCARAVSNITPIGATKRSRTSNWNSDNYNKINIQSDRKEAFDTYGRDGKRVELKLDDLASVSDEEKEALLHLFLWLHKKLVKPLHSNIRRDTSKLMPGTVEDQLQEIIQKDDNLLLECLQYLALGSTERVNDDSTAGSNIKKQCFLAMENIVRASNNKGSALRALMGEYCSTHVKDSNIHILLSKLGVAHSRTRARTIDNSQYIENLKKGPDLLKNLLDLVIMAYDNVGFKWRQGFRAKKSHLNYTLIKLIFVPYEELKRRGLYPGDVTEKNWDNGKDWESERGKDTCTIESVVYPTDKDYDNLAEVREQYLHTVLRLAELKVLPSIAYAKCLLRERKRIIGTLVIDDDAQIAEAIAAGDAELIGDYEDEVIYDNPMCKDIAKTDVVQELMQYGSDQVLGEMRKLIDDKLPDLLAQKGLHPDTRAIMSRSKLKQPTDGGPYGIACDLLYEKDLHSSLNVEPMLGGFHLMLEMFKKSGPMFYNTHLIDILHLWRDSEQQIKWITEPSDPNQSEQETDIIHHSTMHAVLIGLLHKLKTAAQPGVTKIKVTAKDLDEHMKIRATKNPRCAAILLHTRFDCVIRMLKKAEKEGSRDLLMGAMKFSQMLFTNSNAYRYVKMVFHMMIHGYCSSEAELEILEVVLFRRTKSGKTIFMDRDVEWAMRIVRRFLGRFYNCATDQRFKNLTTKLNVNKKILQKSEIKKEAAGTINHESYEEIEFNSIYLETLVYQDESRMWYEDEENQRVVPSKPFMKREHSNDEPIFLSNNVLTSMSSNEPMHDDLLFIVSRGGERIEQAFEELKKSSKRKLTKTGTRFAWPETATKNIDKLYSAIRSLKVKEVYACKKYTKEYVQHEIKRHYTKLERDNECPSERDLKKGKEDLCKDVVRLRKERIKKLASADDADAATANIEWNEISVEEFLDATSNREIQGGLMERVKEEFKHRFFTLENTKFQERWGSMEYDIELVMTDDTLTNGDAHDSDANGDMHDSDDTENDTNRVNEAEEEHENEPIAESQFSAMSGGSWINDTFL